jgi:hypothetical protein
MCIVCGPGGNRFIQSVAGRYAPGALRSRARFIAEEVAPVTTPPLDPTDLEDLKGPADVILHGGPILTLCGGGDAARAIAVRAGRIQAVGDVEQVSARRGRLTRTIDLDGRALLPGFVIADWHPPLSLLCDWLEAERTTEAALSAWIAERSGEWLVLRVGESAEDRSKAMVVAAGSRPAAIVDRTGLILGASAAAVALAPELGLASLCETPPQGRPQVSSLLPVLLGRLTVSRDALRARLRALLGDAARGGVTTLRFCGLGALAGGDDPDLLRSAAGDSPPLRLRGVVDAGLALQSVGTLLSPGFGDDMFRIDTATRWIDGRKADARDLAETVMALRNRGWRVTLHANDSDTVDLALDAFSTAATAATLLDTADGVERRGPIAAGNWARLRRLGLSTGLVIDEGIGPGGAAADLGEAGDVPLSVSLDSMAGLSGPLQMLSGAADLAGKALWKAWLSSVTRGAATRCGAGAILGSLEVGKYADFAFLSDDPGHIDPRGVRRIRCVGTWVAGREIHP